MLGKNIGNKSFGKCFLGDNGVYVISILLSFIVINIINYNNLNPIIAINLLWYPAFENLFGSENGRFRAREILNIRSGEKSSTISIIQ